MDKIKWTPEMNKQLYGLKQSGMNWNEIADVFGASRSAVENKYWSIRKQFIETQPTAEPVQTVFENNMPDIKATEPVPQTKSIMISDMYVMIVNLAETIGFNIEHIEINRMENSWFALAAGIDNSGGNIRIELMRGDAQVNE